MRFNMKADQLPIRYEVAFTTPDSMDECFLPIWIPIQEDPMKYIRHTLDEIYPNGYDIINVHIPTETKLSDEQLELNERYICKILNMLGAYPHIQYLDSID